MRAFAGMTVGGVRWLGGAGSVPGGGWFFGRTLPRLYRTASGFRQAGFAASASEGVWFRSGRFRLSTQAHGFRRTRQALHARRRVGFVEPVSPRRPQPSSPRRRGSRDFSARPRSFASPQRKHDPGRIPAHRPQRPQTKRAGRSPLRPCTAPRRRVRSASAAASARWCRLPAATHRRSALARLRGCACPSDSARLRPRCCR